MEGTNNLLIYSMSLMTLRGISRDRGRDHPDLDNNTGEMASGMMTGMKVTSLMMIILMTTTTLTGTMRMTGKVGNGTKRTKTTLYGTHSTNHTTNQVEIQTNHGETSKENIARDRDRTTGITIPRSSDSIVTLSLLCLPLISSRVS